MKTIINLIKLHKVDLVVLFSLIIIGTVTLQPLFYSGYTTNDDTMQHLLAQRENISIFEVSTRFAQGQGRFFFHYSGILILLPYLIHSWWFTKSLALGMVLVNALLLGVFVGQIFKSKWLGYIAIVVFFTTIQNSWEHNLLTAYPFVFTTSVSWLLISGLLALKYRVSGKGSLLWFSAVAYFLSLLTYEVFLVYLPLLIALLYPGKLPNHFKLLLKRSVPFLLMTALYLGLYIVYKNYHLGGYDGNKVDGTSVYGFFRTVFQFGIASTPLYFYLHDYYRTFINIVHFSLEGDRRNPLFILFNSEFSWYVKAIFSAVITYFGIIRATPLLHKHLGVKWLAAAGYVFMPVIPLGLTFKYQNWAETGAASGFTVTYFSFLAMVVWLITTVLLVVHFFRRFKRMSKIIPLIVALMIGGVSLLTDYFNAHISITQRQASLKWDAVDHWLTTDSFKSIPEQSLVYAPSLWNYMNHSDYWSEYVNIMGKKQLTIVNSPLPVQNFFAINDHTATPAAYFLLYAQEPDEVQDYLLLAQINQFEQYGDSAKVVVDEITLYTRGLLKRFYVFIGFDNYNLIHQVDGEGMSIVTDEPHVFVSLNKQWPGDVWREAVIRSKGIRADQVLLSHYVDAPLQINKRTESLWRNGCYEREGTDEYNWHWCSTNGELVLINYFSYPRKVIWSGEFVTGYDTPSLLGLDFNDSHENLSISNEPIFYQGEIILEPGENVVKFSSLAERHAPEDPRDIRFGVFNFSIKEEYNNQVQSVN